MSDIFSTTQSILRPAEAEANRQALLILHETFQGCKAQFRRYFPTLTPGEVRYYEIPAELTVDGELTQTTLNVAVCAAGISLEDAPEGLDPEYRADCVFRVNLDKVTPGSEQEEDESSECGTSVLDSMIRFRNFPDRQFPLPLLLESLGIPTEEFARLPFEQPLIDCEDLQVFADWVNRSLESLYEDAPDSGSNAGHVSDDASMDEADGERSDASSIKSGSSGQSRASIPVDASSGLLELDHAFLSRVAPSGINSSTVAENGILEQDR